MTEIVQTEAQLIALRTTPGNHTDPLVRCLLGHADGHACIKCATCLLWIRPEDMDAVCPKRGTL